MRTEEAERMIGNCFERIDRSILTILDRDLDSLRVERLRGVVAREKKIAIEVVRRATRGREPG